MSRLRYIAIFPYSSNIRRLSDGSLQPVLSVLSQMALAAGLELHAQYPEATLLLPGETCYGTNYPTTGDVMLAAVVENQVNTKVLRALRNGRYLNNTWLQARAIAENAARGDDVLCVALAYHAPRVRQILSAYGVEAKVVTAESVLRRAGVKKYDKYQPYIQGLGTSEHLLLLLGKLDRHGHLVNALTRLFGPRMVDIVKAGRGWRLESTRAKRRLRTLSR